MWEILHWSDISFLNRMPFLGEKLNQGVRVNIVGDDVMRGDGGQCKV